MTGLHVTEAGPADATELLGVVHRAFGARPTLDPPSTAPDETVESVAAALAAPGAGGVIARRDGESVGAMLLDRSRPGRLGLRRVSVDPAHQGHGVASAMVGVAEDVCWSLSLDGCWLTARSELPETVAFWLRRGYHETVRTGTRLELAKTLPAVLTTRTTAETKALGARLATLCRAGDLVLVSGELGAGKTTLTQGIGAGLGIRGDVCSPTFVIARVHPPAADGPALVHVDAYRLGGPAIGAAELDDLDLDTSVAESLTVVEWGGGVAERLADTRLEVRLDPLDGTETRQVRVQAYGARWATAPLTSTLGRAPGRSFHWVPSESRAARGL